MSACPKCKQKLSLLYLKQNCPHCNVNLRFYNYEENFYADAKRAELSLAKINIFIAHLKASLIGSKLTMVRLCIMLLPIASFLVPYGSVQLHQPFLNKNIAMSALGIYEAYADNLLPYLLSMLKSRVLGEDFLLLVATVGVYALSAVAALLIFFLSALCFLSIKKMHKVLTATACIGAVFAVASTVLLAVFGNATQESAMLAGSATPGCIVSVLCFAAVCVNNILIGKQGLNIVYKEGDLERVAIAAKVKAGEIRMEDLPQPIVETEETRKIQEEIKKQQQLYHAMEAGDDHE